MATYYADNEPALRAALSSGYSSIDILITGDVTLDSPVTVPVGSAVTLGRYGGDYSLTRGAVTSELISVPSTSSLTISNLTVDGNRSGNLTAPLVDNAGSLTLNQGAVLRNNGSRERGCVVNSGTMTMNADSSITDNIVVGMTYEGDGAGVYNTGELVMNGSSRIAANTAASSGTLSAGGGIFNKGSVTLNGDVSLTNNAASGNGMGFGGGIYNDTSGTVRINGGRIFLNTAETSGGGIWNYGVLDLCGSVIISANRANEVAGGVMNYGVMTMTSSLARIDANSAYIGGGVYTSASFSMSAGEITDNDATMGGGIYEVTSHMHISGGKVSDNRAYLDGGGIYCLGGLAGTVTIDGDAVISGNSANNDGGGVWIDYDRLSELDVGPDVVFSGNTARAAYDRNPVDDATYHGHVQARHWTDPFLQGYNNFDISYSNGALLAVAVISAQKTTAGAPVPAGGFLFELVPAGGGAPVATAVNDGSGKVKFTVPLTSAGGDFIIREAAQAPPGWTLDTASYRAAVSVDSGMAYVSYPDGAAIFQNSYSAQPASVRLTASKTANGAPLPADQFDFGLFDSNGNLIATARAGMDGSVAFPEISVTEAGVTDYTVRELTADGGGWVSDTAEYPVRVTATDTGTGLISADVSYPSGAPAFTNTYTAVPASESVTVYKELKGWGSAEIPFTFGLYDDAGNLIETAVNSDGLVGFSPIPYTSPGVHTYTVREITPAGSGWTADPAVIPVSVTVTDDGAGRLISATSYPEGQPAFTNTYSPAPASAGLAAVKSASGAGLAQGRFTFAVLDEAGSPVASAANREDGSVAFPPIEYSAAGTYGYTVVETSPDGNGWTGDTRAWPVKVQVDDDGLGRLTARVEYPEGLPAFENTFSSQPPVPPQPPVPAAAFFTAGKTLQGARLCAGMFTFGVFDRNGNEVARASNSACGDVVFPPVMMGEAGSFPFTIRELNPGGCGWITDTRSFAAAVTVTGGTSGSLTADVTYPGGPVCFVNRYCPPRRLSKRGPGRSGGG